METIVSTTIKWDKPGTGFWRLVFCRDFYTHPEVDLPRGVAEIARAIGMSEFTLRDQVKKRRLPRLEQALTIAREAGITTDELGQFYPQLVTVTGGDQAQP